MYHKLRNNSLYTMFFVLLLILHSSSIINIFKHCLLFTLDKATYNWPWVKTGCLKNKPTFDNDCPWLLFMVMEKHTEIGNCLLWNLYGILLFVGVKDILGINVRLPILLPDMIYASITRFPKDNTRNLVPLHNPDFWSIFLNNITGTPTFSTILWFGKSDNLRPFKTSGEYKFSSNCSWNCYDSHRLSELRYSF